MISVIVLGLLTAAMIVAVLTHPITPKGHVAFRNGAGKLHLMIVPIDNQILMIPNEMSVSAPAIQRESSR